MLTSHRLAIIALGLALAVVLLWAFFHVGHELGKQRGQAGHYAREHAANAQKHIADTCGNLIGTALTICVAEAVEASREHERAEYDLSAQREMAKWAGLMFVATVVMAAITAVGVFFVWQTLTATQKMAADTREIGEAQTRAYVAFSHIDLIVTKGGRLMFRPMIANSGQTPALILKVVADCGQAKPTPERKIITNKERFKYSIEDMVEVNYDLGSKSNYFITVGEISVHDAIEAYNKGVPYFVFGKIIYRDVFQMENQFRETEFCNIVNFKRNPRGAVSGMQQTELNDFIVSLSFAGFKFFDASGTDMSGEG